jgi:hypothetical protein
MNYKELHRLQVLAAQVDGVLTMSDIRVLFSRLGDAGIFKRLEVLVREGVLVKVQAGIYALPTASLAAISQRLASPSYISTGTVLAKAMAIGSIPAHRVQAIKVGRPRTYRCALGIVEHLSIKQELFFGYEDHDGIRFATPEKAFLDVCYFLSKGRRFSFDPITDVDMGALEPKRIREYLRAYDQRFISFFDARWRLP